jgi:hypothetical protein
MPWDAVVKQLDRSQEGASAFDVALLKAIGQPDPIEAALYLELIAENGCSRPLVESAWVLVHQRHKRWWGSTWRLRAAEAHPGLAFFALTARKKLGSERLLRRESGGNPTPTPGRL